MKRTLSPKERDDFAVAVSAVEGIARSAEQARLFAEFDANNLSLVNQLKVLVNRYSIAR